MGASPRFSPSSAERARQELLEQVRRDPSTYGLERSRWTLALIRDKSSLLPDHLSVSAVHRTLAALGICWKRGRSYVHSPDALYDAKCRSIAEIRQEVKADTSSLALLYLDEVTFERQPSLSNDYESRGATSQPLGRRSIGSNVTTRYVASMDALTGRVISRRASHITLATLVNHYLDVSKVYSSIETIYIVQDNWPVHTHPDVLCALQPQIFAEHFRRPASWSTQPSAAAKRKWSHLNLPIQIVPLPTYASWLNPIEKLWRWMRQELGHLHRWADDLARYRHNLDQWLARFLDGSTELLRYVGLSGQ